MRGGWLTRGMSLVWVHTSCLFATSKRDGSRSRLLAALPKPDIPMAAKTSMLAIMVLWVVAGREMGGRSHCPRHFHVLRPPLYYHPHHHTSMLKRQRPATPPPSSLGDPPSFIPNGLIRPFQPSHTVDPPQPHSKRQRTQPPPLDGSLRGWLESEPAGSHWESDGEEDWIEDLHTVSRSPLPPSASQYKDTNSLLHELHVLNQHRLLFAHPGRDRRLNPDPRVLQPPVEHIPAAWTGEPPCRPAPLEYTRDGLAGQSYRIKEKGLVEEVQCVRQRYEDTNRYGAVFL